MFDATVDFVDLVYVYKTNFSSMKAKKAKWLEIYKLYAQMILQLVNMYFVEKQYVDEYQHFGKMNFFLGILRIYQIDKISDLN